MCRGLEQPVAISSGCRERLLIFLGPAMHAASPRRADEDGDDEVIEEERYEQQDGSSRAQDAHSVHHNGPASVSPHSAKSGSNVASVIAGTGHGSLSRLLSASLLGAK